MRVAQLLLARGSKTDAVEVLTVWAAARNDADGHKLLAEALRYSSDSPLAKAAFASMEGLAGAQPLLESARAKWTPEVLARFEGQGFGAFKPALAEVAVAVLAPISARMKDHMADPAGIDRILGEGAARAEAIARPILERTLEIMGMVRSR